MGGEAASSPGDVVDGEVQKLPVRRRGGEEACEREAVDEWAAEELRHSAVGPARVDVGACGEAPKGGRCRSEVRTLACRLGL